MSRKFANQRKTKFLDSIPTSQFESEDSSLTDFCKFNFAYFQNTPPGQDFHQWSEQALHEMLNKLVQFSKNSLSYWMQQGGGRIFAIYGAFPSKSEFTQPKSVPIDALWARFRLDSSTRVIGFVVPGRLNGIAHPRTKKNFDSNTFYVVFLDADHRFYLTETR